MVYNDIVGRRLGQVVPIPHSRAQKGKLQRIACPLLCVFAHMITVSADMTTLRTIISASINAMIRIRFFRVLGLSFLIVHSPF